MVISRNGATATGIYRVRDPIQLLKGVIILLMAIGLAALADLVVIDEFKEGILKWDVIFSPENAWKTWLLIGLHLLAILVFLRIRAIWSGVVIDPESGTFEFPGGSIAANDFADYFRPTFLLQYFLRSNLPIHEIRELSQSTKRKLSSRNGNTKITKRYAININGGFGAASVWFENEGKCDEIYSAIRQLNNMGDPIFRA